MSIKENMDFVKEELNSEEKFLESFVKVERFFKKYKLIIIVAAVVAVVAIVGYSVNSYLKEENRIKANIAFEKAIKNPNDKAALNELKELNTRLYEIVLFKKGEIDKINTSYFKELVMYKKAMETLEVNKLNEVSMQNNFLLKEFAIFNKALILADQGNYEEAKAALKLIPQTSQVKDLVSLLDHYLLTK